MKGKDFIYSLLGFAVFMLLICAPVAYSSSGILYDPNANTLDGYDTSTGTDANTIPVRDSSGNLVGNITGVANSVTSTQTIRDTYRNLTINNSTEKAIVITADEVITQDVSGTSLKVTSVSTGADITVAGAGGLDTGSEASSTWYYIWLIANTTGVNGLLSTSNAAPTLPSGYTYRAFLGAVFNNSGSNMDSFVQYDERVGRIRSSIMTAVLTAADYADTCTSKNLAAYVPKNVRVMHFVALPTAAGAAFTWGAISGNGRCDGMVVGMVATTVPNTAFMAVPVSSQTVYTIRLDGALTGMNTFLIGWSF